MDMSVVKDWEFTLGKTLPFGVWPLSVQKMKAPEPELIEMKAPAGIIEVSGNGYAKAKAASKKVGASLKMGWAVFLPPAVAVPATIKLSHAIRLGAQRLIQVYGSWGDGTKVGCALTAALVGADRWNSRTGGVHAHWPHIPAQIFQDIVTENDVYFRSFEQIAAWVESQGY